MRLRRRSRGCLIDSCAGGRVRRQRHAQGPTSSPTCRCRATRRALAADERRDPAGRSKGHWQAGRAQRRLPGLRRLLGQRPASGTKAHLPGQRQGLRRRPERPRRDRHLQLRLRRDRDPDPQQGARRRRGDGLARQHPVCLTEPSRDLRATASRRASTRTARNYVRVVPNDAYQGAGLASFANEQGSANAYVLYAARRPDQPRPGPDLPRRGRARLGIDIAGFKQLGPEGDELHGPDGEGRRRRRRRGPAGRPDRAERRPLIKDKVSVLGPNERRQAARARRLRPAVDDRPGRRRGRDVRQRPGPRPENLSPAGLPFVKDLGDALDGAPVEVPPLRGRGHLDLLATRRPTGRRSPTLSLRTQKAAAASSTPTTSALNGDPSVGPGDDPKAGKDLRGRYRGHPGRGAGQGRRGAEAGR